MSNPDSTTMRKLIAGMKISADGMFEGPKGYADWVIGWSDDYELTPQIDACVVGGAMYPGHEWYWTTILDNPDKPIPGTETLPTPGEIAWALIAGAGRPLFATGTTRHRLTLTNARQLPDGRMSLFYEFDITRSRGPA